MQIKSRQMPEFNLVADLINHANEMLNHKNPYIYRKHMFCSVRILGDLLCFKFTIREKRSIESWIKFENIIQVKKKISPNPFNLRAPALKMR